MAYTFEFSSEAQNNLQGLDAIVARRIVKKLVWFADQVDPTKFSTRLHGADSVNRRFRIGDYRVVANIDRKKKNLLIVRIGHRSDVYR